MQFIWNTVRQRKLISPGILWFDREKIAKVFKPGFSRPVFSTEHNAKKLDKIGRVDSTFYDHFSKLPPPIFKSLIINIFFIIEAHT